MMDEYTSRFLQVISSDSKRATYSVSVQRMREKVEDIWRYPQHRYFTDHSITHSERILRYLWPLTRPCYPALSDSEIYILVASAYLHDVGMQSEKLDPDLKGNRKIHQDLSVEMIETLDLGVLQPYKDDISLVVRAHRHVPLDADEYEDTQLDDDLVRPRILGSLLRLADELELTHERVDLTRRQYQNPHLDALVHWYRHEYVKSVKVREDTKRIQILYRFPVEWREECTYAIADYVQGVIDDTLREIHPYVWDAQAVFKLEPPDIRESPNASSLPDDVLEELRLEADSRVRQRAEGNTLSSATSTNDDLMKAIRDADKREAAGQPEAAAHYLAIARRFLRGKQYMRAADFAQRAADHYKTAGDKRAGEALLLTAQAHLDRDDPGPAQIPANEALQLAVECDDRAAQAHATLGLVYHLLTNGVHAEMHLKAALQLIDALRDDGGIVRESMLASIYNGLARVALLDDDWDGAADHLRDGLAKVSGLSDRLRLLTRLCNVYLEVGRADDAAPVVAKALAFVDGASEATLRAGVHACAGQLAALRGDTDDVIARYNTAVDVLSGHGQEPYAATLYLEKHAYLMRAGITGIKEDVAFVEQATRIDLARERLHPLVDAQRLQLEGAAAAVDNKAPDARQAYNQALTIYRQYGAFEELRTTLRRSARLYEQTGTVDRAIMLYARVGAVEDVKRLAAIYAGLVGGVEDVEGLLQSLAVSHADSAQVGRAAAYGALADVVPDTLASNIVDDLLTLARGRDSAGPDIAVRRAAIDAITSFSRRVSEDQLATVVEVCLTVPRDSSWWTTEESALNAVARVVGEQSNTVPAAVAARATSALLDKATTERFDKLQETALWAAYAIARRVGGEQRDIVVRYLRDREQGPVDIAYLTALDAPPPAQRLYDTVVAILARIGHQRIETDEGPGAQHGGYMPGILTYFKKHLTPPCMTAIVDHFVHGFDDADDTLRLRAGMLIELGNLANLIPDGDVRTCYDVFSRACRGEVSVGGREALHMETARSPFSRVHVFAGTIVEVVEAGIWGMGRLYQRLPSEQQAEALDALSALADLNDSSIRRAAAGAMGELRQLDGDGFDRLKTTIVVLLRDSEPTVQAWMAQSVAMLFDSNKLDIDRDIVGRVLELGVVDADLDIRRAVAHALKHLSITDLAPDLSDMADEARTRLKTDINFSVRAELDEKDTGQDGCDHNQT